jgi:hypothetical protein
LNTEDCDSLILAMQLPIIASSAHNIAGRLHYTGRFEEALDACVNATRLRQELAKDWPGTFTPDLAASLHSLAHCLSDIGQREEALRTCARGPLRCMAIPSSVEGWELYPLRAYTKQSK